MDNNYKDYNEYNPYTNPYTEQNTEQNTHVYTQNSGETPHATGEKKGAFAGFGALMIKCTAIALVFGLVAGLAFTGVTYLRGDLLGLETSGDGQNRPNGDKKPGSNKNENQTGSNMEQNLNGVLNQTDIDAEISVSVMDVSELVTAVMPSVVAITNTAEKKYQSFWGETYTEEVSSAGSGFIVDQDDTHIYIATNNHVVEGATELEVQFANDTTALAEIKGTVASKDLAVIKVAIKDISSDTLTFIRIASLGDSNALKVGEAAIAIGNALGYGQSVTTGTISALGRSVTVKDSSTGRSIICSNLIQTDAAINPGNSGGALLNASGQVIGINSVKYSDTSVEGIGYAIPISDAMVIIEKLIRGETIDTAKAGYLGIQGSDISEGVFVRKVFSGSAAEKAGICVGDIIVEFEGTQISTMSQLKELLSYYPAGEEVEFVILHAQGNEYVEKEIKVVLSDASAIQD